MSSSYREKIEKLDKAASKLSEKIDKIISENEHSNEWRNIRIVSGRYVNVFLTVTPGNSLMVRICGQKLKNCVKITRAKQLRELIEVIAIIGNAQQFMKVLEDKLTEINGEADTEEIDIW